MVTALLDMAPYGPRDDAAFLAEMNRLTAHHLRHCPEYVRVFPNQGAADAPEALPYLHVSAFKHVPFLTQDGQILHERVLHSSATSSNRSSKITLDRHSSMLQGRSSQAILTDFIGAEKRPLIILDSKASLIQRGVVSARTAAGLALRPFATRVHFGMESQNLDSRVLWEALAAAFDQTSSILVYGFTWVLWRHWVNGTMPAEIAQRLQDINAVYVHSGGWKKLEDERVPRETFNSRLLGLSGPGSKVIDYYGLVEQNGVIFPECEAGWRHVPVWADVLARDPYTHAVLFNQPGQLQLMNITPQGAPYHNVLTEDLGEVCKEQCSCRRSGRRFRLLGRLPKAETRGCANV